MSDNLYNKQEWDRFVLDNNGSFLQSWEWGEFQASVGRKTRRFTGEGWQTQFIANKLPGVNKFYWYCPRGPAADKLKIKNEKVKILEEIIEKVKEAVGKEVIFFRLGPEWELESCHPERSEGSKDSSAFDLRMTDTLKELGFQQLPYDIELSQTLVLDITKTEEELLAQMHEKWRYNIRLAERKGVQVKFVMSDVTNFEYYFEEFYRLVSEGTAERKGIKHHSKEYYRKQLEIGIEKPSISSGNNQGPKFVLFVAEYEGKIITANIVVIFGNRATYLHGATSSEHREVMAPHLLQWEQIKYAKARGCSEYDFWGIVNEHTIDKRGQSWEGFTRFKRGFGGREVNYVGYWDYPMDKKWYWLYRLVQKFRR